MKKLRLSQEFLQDFTRKMADVKERQMFPAPELNDFIFGDFVCRTIWNKIATRPKDEHLHEFIFFIMFETLGKKCYEQEKLKPKSKQHILLKWEQARYDFLKKVNDEGYKLGELLTPTGEVRELMSLASDMYYLQLVHELPTKLKERLTNFYGFQGAKYEIAVSASLIRAGFTIKWTDPRKTQNKIHEFDALQSYTNETIAIEAKSRKRKGTFHFDGALPNFDEIKLDIFGLYNEAMQQNPKDKPFGIFIDINLPRSKTLQKNWKELIHEKLIKDGISMFGEAVPTFLAITNCAWHYDGDQQATNEEFLLLFPEPQYVEFPLQHEITRQTILRAMTLFSKIPEDKLK